MPNQVAQFSRFTFAALFLLLFLAKTPVHAEVAGRYFAFSPTAKDAYRKATSLRFAEAKLMLSQMQAAEPDNLMALFVENYVDFFTVFIDEDKDEYRRLLKNMDKRLDKISRGDRNSPYYLYAQAEIRLQWAILRGKFGEYLTAINETKQAYALLEENRRKFPDFVANQKSLGILHALVGNVPDEYKWAIKLFGGMDGTIEQGLREVESVIAHARRERDFVFGEESLVAYSFLLLHLGNQTETAWTTLKTANLNPTENPLAAFALANLAMKTGKNDEAIKILESCPTGGAFHPFHYRNFMLGLAKLQRLDWDAYKPLEAFVQQFKGMYGVKEAYQKLAWFHLVAGDPAGYKTYIAKAKTHGSDRFEPDKAALREANSGEMPDANLLRARLLFDGGYSQRAYDLLKNAAGVYASNPKLNLEYNYRMGRITHRMGRTQEAVRFFEQTIQTGEKSPLHFACNAALQLGTLQEEKKDWKNARAAYQKCLDINPDDYGASLHARAKAGLNRLKNKG